MKILAIETSCDETAIAIIDITGPKNRPAIKVLANIVSSQIKLHAKFGGVVPNLAKREHQRNLPIILIKALRESKLLKISKSKFLISKQNLDYIFSHEPELLEVFKNKVINIPAPEIDAIAVTVGPGLAPALWVGVNFAKALSYIWDKPLIPVNHMEGHIYSAFLQTTNSHSERPSEERGSTQHSSANVQSEESFIDPSGSALRMTPVTFPALALLVSGGHTELVLITGFGKYKIIGGTLDDAVGEAFDKVARLLKLGYPGGPIISKLAEKGNAEKYPLPRPMLNSKDYNFSFSGLKTAVLYFLRDNPKAAKKDIAAAFESSAIDVLVQKTIRAAKEYKVKSLIVGGGVSANKKLRQNLQEKISESLPYVACHMSLVTLSGDNALMIALAAFFAGKKKSPEKIRAEANLKLNYS